MQQHPQTRWLSVRLRTAARPEEVTPPRAERRALANLRREALVLAQLRSAHTLLHVLQGSSQPFPSAGSHCAQRDSSCHALVHAVAQGSRFGCVPACRWPSAWPAARRSPAAWALDSRAPPRPQEYPTASAPESARHELVEAAVRLTKRQGCSSEHTAQAPCGKINELLGPTHGHSFGSTF